MARIDFSAFQPTDLTIVLGDLELLVPGDLPIPKIIEIDATIKRLSSDDADSTEEMLGLYELLLGVFRIRQPDLVDLPVGPRAIYSLAAAVLNPEAFIEEAVPADPPPVARQRAGTTTRKRTSAKPKATRAKTTRTSGS